MIYNRLKKKNKQTNYNPSVIYVVFEEERYNSLPKIFRSQTATDLSFCPTDIFSWPNDRAFARNLINSRNAALTSCQCELHHLFCSLNRHLLFSEKSPESWEIYVVLPRDMLVTGWIYCYAECIMKYIIPDFEKYKTLSDRAGIWLQQTNLWG